MTDTSAAETTQNGETFQLTPSEDFHFRFRHKITDIQERIEHLKFVGTTGGEQTDAISQCRSSIARLTTEVNDASSYLPNHSRQEYGRAIAGLTEKLDKTCAELAPRPKFSFRSGSLFSVKKNESAISLTDTAELADQRRRQGSILPGDSASSFADTPTDNSTMPSNKSNGTSSNHPLPPTSASPPEPVTTISTTKPTSPDSNSTLIIRDLTNSYIRPTTLTSSITLLNLTNSIIDLTHTSTQATISTLTLKNIHNSLILSPRIEGATHLTNIHGSTLHLTTRQFRMHDSTDCRVYLDVASRPIIEGCSGIGFGPVSTEKVEGKNYWSEVDDFKWLRSEPSPNWRLLGEEELVEEEVWREVREGIDSARERILRRFGMGSGWK